MFSAEGAGGALDAGPDAPFGSDFVDRPTSATGQVIVATYVIADDPATVARQHAAGAGGALPPGRRRGRTSRGKR